MRAKMRANLVSELERTLTGRLKHLGEGDRAALSQMVESATNKLLHAPTTRLRSSVGSANGADYVATLAALFDLPEPDLSGAPSRSLPAAVTTTSATTERAGAAPGHRSDAQAGDPVGDDGDEDSTPREDGAGSAGATSAPVFAAMAPRTRLDS
jgi:glutamyl-tRNA reductase